MNMLIFFYCVILLDTQYFFPVLKVIPTEKYVLSKKNGNKISSTDIFIVTSTTPPSFKKLNNETANKIKEYRDTATSLAKDTKKLFQRASGVTSLFMKVLVGKNLVEKIKTNIKETLDTTNTILKKIATPPTKENILEIIASMITEKDTLKKLKIQLEKNLKSATKLPPFGKKKLKMIIKDIDKLMKLWESLHSPQTLTSQTRGM